MNETQMSSTSDPIYTGTSYVLEILNSTSNSTLGTDPRAGRVSLTQTISMTAAMVILMIITMFGNCLVLGIFYQYTPLRTVTNYFIVSLANADLLVAVLSIPIWIAYLQVDLAQFQYGEGVCFYSQLNLLFDLLFSSNGSFLGPTNHIAKITAMLKPIKNAIPIFNWDGV